MPRLKNQVNFDADAQPSLFRQQHKNQITADLSHWNEVIFAYPHNNQIHLILHWNQVKFDLPHWNRVNSDNPQNSIICMLALKTSDIRPVYKNQVNFDHPTQFISSLHWNQVKFDPPHWNQVNLNHHHKNQANLYAHTKTSNLQSAHKNKVNLDPRTKTSQFQYSH